MGAEKAAAVVTGGAAAALLLLSILAACYEYASAVPVLDGRASLIPARPMTSLHPQAPFVLRMSDGTVVPQCHKPPAIDNAFLDLDLYQKPGANGKAMTLFSVGETAVYHCLPGYYADRPYEYRIKAKCTEGRDGTPYWDVRGICSKYPKCNIPPMLHDAVMNVEDSSRREFHTGERIEYVCDDGFKSSLNDVAPFTTCSFSGFMADWDPIVGDCYRDGESSEIHKKLHESEYYPEDKRVARMRQERDERLRRLGLANDADGAGAVPLNPADNPLSGNFMTITSLPGKYDEEEDPQGLAKTERIRSNVNSVLEAQQSAWDPYANEISSPFFDQTNKYNKTKKAEKKKLYSAFGRPPKVEPTRYDKIRGKQQTEGDLAAQSDSEVQEGAPAEESQDVAQEASDNARTTGGVPLIRKIDESHVGPMFVLHQDDSKSTRSSMGSSVADAAMQMDGSEHVHTSQADIDRDIRLDRLIHHFSDDHPELMSQFKYENIHSHVHKVAALEGDLALIEGGLNDYAGDDDDDADADDVDSDYGDEQQRNDAFPRRNDFDSEDFDVDADANEEGALGWWNNVADCIKKGTCKPQDIDQPRWLSYPEGKFEAKKLAHLITMQKFNPAREPNERGRRRRQKKKSLTPPLPCDGPDCDNPMYQQFWQMQLNPKYLQPEPETSARGGGTDESPDGVARPHQHHKSGRKSSRRKESSKRKDCVGDDCELRPAWGLNAGRPKERTEKLELVKLLWPGGPDVGKSPDYDNWGEGCTDGKCDPEGWGDWLAKPKNVALTFLIISAVFYVLLMLRCLFKCTPNGGKIESDEGNASTGAGSAKTTATTSKSRTGYLDQFDRFDQMEDATSALE